MNYSALVQQIKDFCSNTEATFVANIPIFVNAAEERIYNAVQIPAIRKNQLGALSIDNPYLTLPEDWLATFSLAIMAPEAESGQDNTQHFLLNKDVNFIRESFPDPDTAGMPSHYAQFDYNTLLLGPTPDAAYRVELHYYYYPESIVNAGQTWLGDNFESVLLYGCLREAYLFMKGEADIIGYYEKKYQESLALLKTLGDGKARRDAYRSGQVQVPVL